MFAKYLLVVALLVHLALARECKVYKGKYCPGKNQQTMINTYTCKRTCLIVYSLVDCLRLCSEYKGPICKSHKELTIKNSCNCTKRCVTILGNGQKCNLSKNSMCRKPLRCVDGICKP